MEAKVWRSHIRSGMRLGELNIPVARKPSKHHDQSQPDAATPVPSAGPGGAPGEIVEVIEAKEAWSEYRLADGSVLRLKPVLAEVFKAADQYNEEGEPLYYSRAVLLPSMRIPDHLRKKT